MLLIFSPTTLDCDRAISPPPLPLYLLLALLFLGGTRRSRLLADYWLGLKVGKRIFLRPL